MDKINISSTWIDRTPDNRPELDHTFGSLSIAFDKIHATSFTSDNGDHGDKIRIPAYPLAEWLTSNIWALLHEPRKFDRVEDDPGFRARHWFGTAREGFVLPDLWMYRTDDETVCAHAEPARFPSAQLQMTARFEEWIKIQIAEKAILNFGNAVVSRLNEKGMKETPLHEILANHAKLSKEERLHCTLLGSLGTSPYDVDDTLEQIIAKIVQQVSSTVSDDFFAAATQPELAEASQDLEVSVAALDKADQIDLTALFNLPVAKPAPRLAPWKVGLEAASLVRKEFEISGLDSKGGSMIIDRLKLDRVIAQTGRHESDDLVLQGIVRRDQNQVAIALSQKPETSRRFDAARSCYLTWICGKGGDRLVTRARVRDQQASRAFAAELLAPAEYLRSRAKNEILSRYGVEELANDCGVSPTVVMYQAKNNRIELV